jgi:thiol-disulfide isomerase/thioredoxin
MHILSIHNKAELYKNKQTHVSNKNIVDDLIKHNKHVFVLIYMDGCGPCNATRPEWAKMSHTLKKQYFSRKDVAIIDINKNVLPLIKSLGSVNGFPTMKYITNRGKTVENYEDSGVKKKDRSVDSFINWVEEKIMKGKIVSVVPASAPEHVYKRITKKHGNKHGNKPHGTNKKYKKGSRKNKSRKQKAEK